MVLGDSGNNGGSDNEYKSRQYGDGYDREKHGIWHCIPLVRTKPGAKPVLKVKPLGPCLVRLDLQYHLGGGQRVSADHIIL